MSVFVLWLGLSLAVAVFANNRGRSGLGWFVLSVLLSPLLGLLFVAVSKDLSRGTPSGMGAAAGQVACPACAEWVQPAAKLCKHCGTTLTPTANAEAMQNHRALEQDAQASIQLVMVGVVMVVLVVLVMIWLK